nr:Tcell receptor gamma chain [Mus musculus]
MLLLRWPTFCCLWVFGLGQLEQTELSVTRATDESAQISCIVSLPYFSNTAIHWYRQKAKKFEYLIYVSTNYNQRPLGGKNKKIEASKDFQTSTSTLKINYLKKEDEATYYCAVCRSGTSWVKIFAKGTKLVVIPPDKRTDSDFSPKPTIFLPSAAETNLHKAGTYLCLLEKFFPKVIRVYWKEKDGEKILESQEGNTIKTNDRYMKFSWLTVTEDSMAKEHSCIVKHENNKRGVDQEILFPPIGKAFTTINVNPRDSVLRHENVNNATDLEDCMKGRKDMLQLQVTTTYAFYTYLILFFKSMVHLAFVVFCLFRRAAMSCDDQRS